MLHLHVAKQTIKWAPQTAISGWDAPEMFYDLLKLYGCAMGNADEGEVDEYTRTFEVDKQDLIRMRNSLASQDEFYLEHLPEIGQALHKLKDCSRYDAVKALDVLVNNSDPDNDWVYVSWF